MTDLDLTLTGEEIEKLDAFLHSAAVSEEAMSVVMLNGFLTAIASGLSIIMPSKWLARVWGEHEDDAPTFADTNEALTITTLIVRLMNEVHASLRASTYVPLFEEVPEEHRCEAADVWAHGYMAGVSYDSDAWRPMLTDERGLLLLGPLMILTAPPGFFDYQPTDEEKASLVPILGATAEAIHAYWLDQRSPARVPMNRRVKSTKRKPKQSGRRAESVDSSLATDFHRARM